MSSKKYKTLLKGVQKTSSKKALTLLNPALHSEIVRVERATKAQIELAGLEDYYKMRKGWSEVLRFCLIIILCFNILLVGFVGLNMMSFKDEWFLRLVLTANLAEIIGLVYVVVHFLFSNQVDSVSENK